MKAKTYLLSRAGRKQVVVALSKEDALTACDLRGMGRTTVRVLSKVTVTVINGLLTVIRDGDGYKYGYLSHSQDINSKL